MPICKIHGKAGKGKGRSLKVRKSLKCWSVTEIRWNSKTCLCVIAGAIRTSAKTIHELASWMPHVSAGILLKFFFLCRRITSTAAFPSRCVAKCRGHLPRSSLQSYRAGYAVGPANCRLQSAGHLVNTVRDETLWATIGLLFCYNWAFYPRDEWETEWILPPTLRITDRAPQLTYTSDI